MKFSQLTIKNFADIIIYYEVKQINLQCKNEQTNKPTNERTNERRKKKEQRMYQQCQ